MTEKYRYQDINKVNFNGLKYSVEVFEFDGRSYIHIGNFFIPASISRKDWDNYINQEVNDFDDYSPWEDD